jgi:hypothetical protein
MLIIRIEIVIFVILPASAVELHQHIAFNVIPHLAMHGMDIPAIILVLLVHSYQIAIQIVLIVHYFVFSALILLRYVQHVRLQEFTQLICLGLTA